MCLAIPMKIIEINDNSAVVEANGIRAAIDCSLTPDISIGDKVLVHAGFSIEKLDPEAAASIEETWKEYLEALNKA